MTLHLLCVMIVTQKCLAKVLGLQNIIRVTAVCEGSVLSLFRIGSFDMQLMRMHQTLLLVFVAAAYVILGKIEAEY